MKKKKRFGPKKDAASEDMSLNITSMADIFTILLVFLLKSFSVGVSNISPSNEIILPEVKTADQVKETLKLEIGPTAVLVDDKAVASLRGFQFDPADLGADGTSKSLTSALSNVKRRGLASVGQEAGDQAADPQAAPKKNTRLMVLADQRTPYSTLSSVMASAGSSGYTEIKLVVVQEQ